MNVLLNKVFVSTYVVILGNFYALDTYYVVPEPTTLFTTVCTEFVTFFVLLELDYGIGTDVLYYCP